LLNATISEHFQGFSKTKLRGLRNAITTIGVALEYKIEIDEKEFAAKLRGRLQGLDSVTSSQLLYVFLKAASA
jgi:hypothetical protein